uniref:Uncharacterized protein LOC103318979 n=1 Tax=Rhizophora mucronata TaxID=61149 RepID=A0A2P2Q2S5_RHIMU
MNITFNVFEAIKYLFDDDTCFTIDTLDHEVNEFSHSDRLEDLRLALFNQRMLQMKVRIWGKALMCWRQIHYTRKPKS